MKQWKYTSGIMTACIAIYMVFRLMMAEMGGLMFIHDFDIPVGKASIVAICSIACGFFSMVYAEDLKIKGFLIPSIMFAASGAVFVCIRDNDLDILFFSIWFIICALVDLGLAIVGPKIIRKSRNNYGYTVAAANDWVTDIKKDIKKEEIVSRSPK